MEPDSGFARQYVTNFKALGGEQYFQIFIAFKGRKEKYFKLYDWYLISETDTVCLEKFRSPGKPKTEKRSINSALLFDFDSYKIDKAEGLEELSKVAKSLIAQLKQIEKIEISGHTDSIGTYAHNSTLSLKRAEAVRDQFVELGIPAGIIKVIGMGSAQPLTDNKEEQYLNRRVEIVVFYK
jgi:outer membrane protein OmpA-like peptidoglycan-associated protein